MMEVEDDMEIVIGKLFFLISSAWAFVVLYRIAASLLTHRRPAQRVAAYPPQLPARPVHPEKPKQAHINWDAAVRPCFRSSSSRARYLTGWPGNISSSSYSPQPIMRPWENSSNFRTVKRFRLGRAAGSQSGQRRPPIGWGGGQKSTRRSAKKTPTMRTRRWLKTRRCIWIAGFTTATARRSRRAGSNRLNGRRGDRRPRSRAGWGFLLLGGRRNFVHRWALQVMAYRIGDQNHALFLDLATSPLMTAGLCLSAFADVIRLVFDRIDFSPLRTRTNPLMPFSQFVQFRDRWILSWPCDGPQHYFLVNTDRFWLILGSLLSKILNRFRKFRNKGFDLQSRLIKI